MIRILLSSIALAALIIALPSATDALPRKYKHSHKLKKTAEATSKKTPGSAIINSNQPVTQNNSSTTLAGTKASTLTLDINTATKPELIAVPGLSGEQLWMMTNFRTSLGYADAQDFATKVCSLIGINMGATDLKIGSNIYQGFQCAKASLTYQADGNVYSYALPVELTGSDTTPPAPPE